MNTSEPRLSCVAVVADLPVLWATRAFVAAEGDFYVCPLSEKQLSRAERRELLRGVQMSLEQVVWAYRGQYRVEDDWARLKGRPLGVTPVYLQDQERIQGLV